MSPFDFSYSLEIDGRSISLWRAKLVYGFARLVGVRVSLYTRVVALPTEPVGTPEQFAKGMASLQAGGVYEYEQQQKIAALESRVREQKAAPFAGGLYQNAEMRCVSCKHEWVAVFPIEAPRLECPQCKYMNSTERER